MLDKIREIICRFVDIAPEDITPETNIRHDLGLNSLELINLAVEIEEEFDVEIPDEDAEKLKTVKTVLEYVQSKI